MGREADGDQLVVGRAWGGDEGEGLLGGGGCIFGGVPHPGRTLAEMPVLEVARFQVHRLLRMETVSEVLERAERETPMHSLERLTEKKGQGRVFRTQLPVLRRLTGDKARAVLASLKTYSRSLLPERRTFLEQFRPVDVAFKVVGTGSVGLRDYCVYWKEMGRTIRCSCR